MSRLVGDHREAIGTQTTAVCNQSLQNSVSGRTASDMSNTSNLSESLCMCTSTLTLFSIFLHISVDEKECVFDVYELGIVPLTRSLQVAITKDEKFRRSHLNVFFFFFSNSLAWSLKLKVKS